MARRGALARAVTGHAFTVGYHCAAAMPPTAPLAAASQRIASALQAAARAALGQELPDLVLAQPPSPAMGDFAVSACLPLAKVLKRRPREIAEAVVSAAGAVPGVARMEVAGPGYVNVFLDRRAFALDLLASLESDPPPPRDVFDAPRADRTRGKTIVEHTNINPNKAAHVGHLRNAVLGDCLVRLLQHAGEPVEVQNYIDDTGVQVADVVVAFTAMEGRTPEAALEHVERLVAAPVPPFDHACWDTYAAVSRWLAEDPARAALRQEALHAMETGDGPLAALGARIASAIVARHLALMDRIGVRYHVLPHESDILAARFWQTAFERLKSSGAVHLATLGKNAGCWVMPLTETDAFKNLEDPDKVIVRANGTVTYVGKDIAYQMWKLGLLGLDFRYRPHLDHGGGKVVWTTDTRRGSAGGHPPFGGARRVFNVIDARQSYLQAIVKNALLLLGHHDQAEASVHFSYEMVALTPRTAERLGFELTEGDRGAAYVEMSGRRGLGVKADDLLDQLFRGARALVAQASQERAKALTDEEIDRAAEQVAVGAMRYYMARVTRGRVIAFDVDDALQFQGETGPYLQYSTVRAANIFRKLAEEGVLDVAAVPARARETDLGILVQDATWEVLLAAARVPEAVDRAIQQLEVAHLAKHAFALCQAWNTFYRDNSLLHAESESLRWQRALVARVFLLAQRQVLGLLGIPEPERM
jgi:arginyl-tRNA synthetase